LNLQQAQERCRANPQTCPLLQERVEPLIRQAGDIAALEELKQRCREAGAGNCQEFIALCRLHPDLCFAPDPPGPVIDRLDEARDRLQALQRLCDKRDTKACRQIAQICASHPVLCPEPPRPPVTRPSAPIERPAVEPTTSSGPRPTPTTAAQRVAPTPSPVGDQRPTR
jgi:hypothetical protein